MSLVVQKYGGTSVGSPEKIIAAAARVAALKKEGHSVVVVVSAMGHTTDELLALARRVSPHPAPRELDMLLTAGERISMALLSMALTDLGVSSISFTGSQAGIITDESHNAALIVDIRPQRVKDELAQGRVVIIAGFQGVSRTKEVTTLGRGGSDTTAVAMAVALGAERCEILTDVRGVYSADPNKVPQARNYDVLPLEVVYELALGGAQVMHERAIKTAMESSLNLYVGHSSVIVPGFAPAVAPGFAPAVAPGFSPAVAPAKEKGTLLVPLSAQSFASGHVLGLAQKDMSITLVGVNLGGSTQVTEDVKNKLASLGYEQARLTPGLHSIKIDLESASVGNNEVHSVLIALHGHFISSLSVEGLAHEHS